MRLRLAVIDELQCRDATASTRQDRAASPAHGLHDGPHGEHGSVAKFRVLEATVEVIDDAIQLLLTRYLTPIDALQAATAKSAVADAADVIVVSSDRKLSRLAAELGMQALDPTGP